MTDQLILELVTTITLFCNSNSFFHKECFKEIWQCGHNVTDTIAVVSETHNCISRYIEKN